MAVYRIVEAAIIEPILDRAFEWFLHLIAYNIYVEQMKFPLFRGSI